MAVIILKNYLINLYSQSFYYYHITFFITFRNTLIAILINRLSLKETNIKSLYVNYLSVSKAFRYLTLFSKVKFF